MVVDRISVDFLIFSCDLSFNLYASLSLSIGKLLRIKKKIKIERQLGI